MKIIEEINEKITRQEATVLTAAELKSMVRDGQKVTADDVDVVTTATFNVMYPDCPAMRTCPTEAISDRFIINRDLCINCGTCTLQCPAGVFRARLGSIEIDEGTIPISLRQSDRIRAEKLCTMLKDRILNQKFVPTKMIEPL